MKNFRKIGVVLVFGANLCKLNRFFDTEDVFASAKLNNFINFKTAIFPFFSNSCYKLFAISRLLFDIA